MEKSNEKAQVFNLIILDKSGSMVYIRDAAIDGFNKTVEGIRAAQRQFAATQEHYVSLLPFCACEMEYVYDCVPVEKVKTLRRRDYEPCCATPLYDAMGRGINDLLKKTKDVEGASVAVTIITDGWENASHEYDGRAIKALVDRMREEYGWNFAYIGANQDVEAVAAKLSITNTMTFSYDSAGMHDAWERERKARLRMYGRMDEVKACMAPSATREERRAMMREVVRENRNYQDMSEFAHRVTPQRIRELQPGQVLVFGSNAQGAHNGGMAREALRYGAVMGQAEGLQGNTYAIVSMEGLAELREQAERMVRFARQHPELTFLVPAIGCGTAGYTPQQVAPLFAKAVDVENVWLPQLFWDELV